MSAEAVEMKPKDEANKAHIAAATEALKAWMDKYNVDLMVTAPRIKIVLRKGNDPVQPDPEA